MGEATYKVLVCGGRDYRNWEKFCAVMNAIHAERRATHIISGGASGADEYAYRYAILEGIQPVQCVANWGAHDKAAGPIRNQRMLELGPDFVVAFPGGKGTADMLKQAKAAGIAWRKV